MTLLRQRWPWLLIGAAICLALCARSDYRIQERAKGDIERLAQQLSLMAGSGQSLQWLAVYPEINSVTITGPERIVLGSYQNPQPSARSEHDLQRESSGLRVEIKAALPPLAALTTEMPFLLLTLVLLAMLVPARSAPLATGADASLPQTELVPLSLDDARPGKRVLERDDSMRIERSGHSQKIEALGRLAGGVAHDFNNLLASMLFNLDAALACLPDDSPASTYLGEVQLASNKAVALTSQLLLYSRKERVLPRLLSGHRAIEEAARLAHGMRPEVELKLRLQAQRDAVLLDHGQLDQVLLNLIVNAKDATKQGTIEISTLNRTVNVSQTLLKAGEYLVIKVRDEGSGVPKEIQAKIFEPYFTTKEVGKGTGLGLSTSLAIVEKAGGQLTLTSVPGETVFAIWLPSSGEDLPLAEIPSADLDANPPLRTGQTILLVEDEVSILKILKRLLEAKGFSVTSASTGTRAASLLEASNGFDILVTDLLLPGLTGVELAKLFQHAYPGRPVLFMSGFPGDTLDGAELSANSRFLAKPFSPKQLMESLAQLMEVSSS